MKELLDKQIEKIKLTLTTNCNLCCPYCFVNKTNERMEWDVAESAIDLLIQSKGEEKLLSLYGGEPLIEFELIKKLTDYSIEQSKKYNKQLNISICTNLTLLKPEHIDFFIKNNIKLIASLAGEREIHNKVRVFSDKNGSYDVVVDNLSKVLKNMNKDNLGISFCVFPESVKDLDKNFIHLLKLGFNYINFEIIREYNPWSKEDILLFSKKYKQIIKYVVSEIRKGNFIFLNHVNWNIKKPYLSGLCCPFSYILEVYPNGDLAFSPFLLNTEDKERFLIGNLKEDKVYRFGECIFSKESEECKNCMHDYFKDYDSDVGASITTRIYRNLSLKTAEYILEMSDHNQFKEYVSYIKNKVCF